MASLIHQHLIQELKSKRDHVMKGGGEVAIRKQHAKGKLTARERISLLIDSGSHFLEIGLFAGEDLYDESCPSGGVITGIGTVEGRLCVIVANDATVKAGAWFPITAKKNLRAQEIAMENRLPIIYLVDSAGIYLPLQSEVFADKEHFGRVFRNNARISAMGIVQISAIMGSCVAGGAYLPIMSDEALIVENTGSLFLAGPFLVKSAIGEEVDAETLGGAKMHCEVSGVTDQKFPDDASCILAIRQKIGQIGGDTKAGFNRIASVNPAIDPQTIWDFLPDENQKPYDVWQVLQCIIDEGSAQEYKPDYGKTLICAYVRVDGWAVGIVANQRKNVKSGKGEMQMGGVIYGDAADKAARFIMNCNQKKIPLVFFQDVTGFMVGSRAEQSGIIKDGAKMVSAVANSVVPKFTFIMGNSYGAGNYAMCGKSYDPRLIYSWPTAQMAVMSGNTAANTLLQIQKSVLKSRGEAISTSDEQVLLETISKRYRDELSPYYAAARLWIDGIIDPAETRAVISKGIEMANHAPVDNPFQLGVFQV